MWLIIIIGIILLIFILVSLSTPENSTANNQNTKVKTIELAVPDPTATSPEKFLDFLEKTPNEYLWQVEAQLYAAGKLKNIVYKKAIDSKLRDNKIDKNYFLKILKKTESESYDLSEIDLEDYEFRDTFEIAGVHVGFRKENIVFEIDEGAELILKREPYNKFDKNAIGIWFDNTMLGYVPAVRCEHISEIMKFKHKAVLSDVILGNDGFLTVYVNIYASEEQNENPEYYLDNETILELRSRKIESKYLRPKKDAEDDNIFYKKKVVITGTFTHFPDRNELAKLVYDSGADIDTCITERTHYAIVGDNPGWKKMEQIEEFGVMCFSEEETRKMYNLN